MSFDNTIDLLFGTLGVGIVLLCFGIYFIWISFLGFLFWYFWNLLIAPYTVFPILTWWQGIGLFLLIDHMIPRPSSTSKSEVKE